MINEATIRKACSDLAEILVRKNSDYGNSVQEQFNEYGETSISIRLDDKLRRFKQLQHSEAKVKDESKADTLLDAAGYSILGYICVSSDEPVNIWTVKQATPYDINFNPTPKYFDPDDQ